MAWVKEHHPTVNALRDVTMEMLDEFVAPKDSIVYSLCKYVVEEIQRLLNGCNDLEMGDIAGLGKKMYGTHQCLSKLYEVSCKVADFLVDAVKNNPAVLGARMMGGGFGGCTISIVQEDAIIEMVETVAAKYKATMGLELSVYISNIENGTEVIKVG